MRIGNIFNQINNKYKSHNFTNLNFDSRKCKKGDIFFSIKGTKKNGSQFIEDALNNGARTIVSEKKYQGFVKNILYLHSNNPRKLLSESAAKIFKQKPNNLIAVTGTNGKSSITNFYYQILKLNKVQVASIGTLGVYYKNKFIKTHNTTTDPITLNKLLQKIKKNGINNVIMEASSHGLKQNRLDGIKFKTGIFTNLSRDHLDYHNSYLDYFNSKMILFKNLMHKKSCIIFDKEIKVSKSINKIVSNKNYNSICIGKSFSDVKITKHNYIADKQHVEFAFKNKKYFFKTSLLGKIQIKNLIMAMIAAKNSNIPLEKIVKSINKIKSVNGRLEEIVKFKDNSRVILDYAHTPDALETCLKNLNEQFKFSKISIVFGCGGDRDKQKRKIMGQIANKYCERIYLTDDNPRTEDPNKIRSQIKKKIKKYKLIEIPSRKVAISQSIKDLEAGHILLIAGKGHENYQEYNIKKPFSDKKHILQNKNLKNKSLLDNWKLSIIDKKLKNIKFNKNLKINSASINSREIKKNDIFFAIKGKRFDGNKYANEAIKKGASLSIIDKDFKIKNKRKIKVKNSLNFLTKCSKSIREISLINAISITGSSGKTSLKELLGYTLNQISSATFSKKSFNNKYGVPLSLFNIKKKNLFGVFEVGMDKKGEIDKLTKIINPDVGIITNISYAHIKNFKNLKDIAKAKSEIINNITNKGYIILNKDDIFYDFFLKKAIARKLKIISFSIKKNSDIKLLNIKRKKKYYIFNIKIHNQIKKFKINENLKKYSSNILATCAVLSIYFSINEIKDNIFFKYQIPEGRGDVFNLKYKNKKIKLIDESYNSNPLSLEFAIKNFEEIKVNPKNKYLLLGDMLELGKFSKQLHVKAAKFINNSNFNKLYVVGKHIKDTFNKIKTQKQGKVLKNNNEIFDLFKNVLKNKDYIMVKGSNASGLNKIISIIKKDSSNAL